jgi:heme-degrading monooxygenase HmoA
MFARKVAARLKPNSLREFTNLIESEILPWLRKQEGFLDLMILAGSDGIEIAAISFWDNQGSAEAYSASGYPQVLQALGKLLDGRPYVKVFEVVRSAFQWAAHRRAGHPAPVRILDIVPQAQPARISLATCKDNP